MTNVERECDSGTDGSPGHLEIDALLDGEAVDTHAVRAALEDAAARDYLVDALLLRRLTHDMGPTRCVFPATPHRSVATGVRWLAAGLILMVGAGLGYVQGQRTQTLVTSPGSVEVSLDTSSAPPPPPEPTRLIRFEPGVNWTTETNSR